MSIHDCKIPCLIDLQIRERNKKGFAYFSTKTYVVGT